MKAKIEQLQDTFKAKVKASTEIIDITKNSNELTREQGKRAAYQDILKQLENILKNG